MPQRRELPDLRRHAPQLIVGEVQHAMLGPVRRRKDGEGARATDAILGRHERKSPVRAQVRRGHCACTITVTCGRADQSTTRRRPSRLSKMYYYAPIRTGTVRRSNARSPSPPLFPPRFFRMRSCASFSATNARRSGDGEPSGFIPMQGNLPPMYIFEPSWSRHLGRKGTRRPSYISGESLAGGAVHDIGRFVTAQQGDEQ